MVSKQEETAGSMLALTAGVMGFAIVGALILSAAKQPEEEPPPPPPGRANLYGKVTDSVTGKPIAGVWVTLNGIDTEPDSQGQYTFEDIAPGGDTVTFEKDGYEIVQNAVALVEGNNELNVAMNPVAGIRILDITGEKKADGSIAAYIRWTHYGLPRWWWDPAYDDSAYSFIEAITSVGRMAGGVWNNYYTVAARGSIPREGVEATATAQWAAEAVAQMPEGLAGFQCFIEAYTIGWQRIALSPTFTTADAIVI